MKPHKPHLPTLLLLSGLALFAVAVLVWLLNHLP